MGGALVGTPLVRFLGLAPYLAVGTTVPVILPSAITGAYTYARSGMVDFRAAATTALPAAAAVVAGAFVTHRINGHVLMLATAAVVLLTATRLLPGRGGPAGPRPVRRGGLALALTGAVAGFFSGLLGIGGGFLVVPAYISLFGFETKVALGTSLAVIAVVAVPNILAQTAVGNIDWRAALLLAAGVVPGARLGAMLSIRAQERRLRITLAATLAAIALVYAAAEIAALSSR